MRNDKSSTKKSACEKANRRKASEQRADWRCLKNQRRQARRGKRKKNKKNFCTIITEKGKRWK